MLCKSPYMAGDIPFGCGQCLPCRINSRRLWTWRMFLESLIHKESCFVTLTYSPEKLPVSGSLDTEHAKNFLKRFRKSVVPLRVRFFLVGEYGDQTQRPHYHLILFGVGVSHAPLIEKAWRCPKDSTPYGFVSVYEASLETFQYVCGYIVKKMTKPDDFRLNGRFPEFSRKSNRPGLGALSMDVIVRSLNSDLGMAEVEKTGDVPHRLMIGGKSIPLGRYLRRVLRSKFGFTDQWIQELKDVFALERQAEMRALLANSSEAQTVEQAFKASVKGKIASLESRSKIFASRREL